MIRSLSATVFLAASLMVMSVRAETTDAAAPATTAASTTETKAALPSKLGNKKFDDEAEITDAKIRAESGSRSRYSIKANLSYYGPPLNDASLKRQPNPDNSNAPKNTALNGSVGVRYRIDRESTVGFGTGIKAVTPTYGIDRFDVNNPSVNYDVTKKIGDAQMRMSPGVALVTTPEYRNTGEIVSLSWDQSIAYQLKDSPFFATLDSSFGYYIFNRAYVPGETRKGGDGNAQTYGFSFFPGLKARLSDKFNVSTSLGVGFYNPRSQKDAAVLWRSALTERLAFGWAVTRDIYIQPYLDLYPQALAVDTTTMNISTIFSIL